jgi:hypothetical protein
VGSIFRQLNHQLPRSPFKHFRVEAKVNAAAAAEEFPLFFFYCFVGRTRTVPRITKDKRMLISIALGPLPTLISHISAIHTPEMSQIPTNWIHAIAQSCWLPPSQSLDCDHNRRMKTIFHQGCKVPRSFFFFFINPHIIRNLEGVCTVRTYFTARVGRVDEAVKLPSHSGCWT